MLRLTKIIAQLGSGNSDALRREQALQEIRHGFTVPLEILQLIQLEFLSEMIKGLDVPGGATIRMLTSFVHKNDTTALSGTYYALDLGGTNFRVLILNINNGKVESCTGEKFAIPQEHMKGSADSLFGFIADKVKAVVPAGATGKLGFTFSFPTNQQAVNSGKLITWTKGFSTTGVVGKDVVALLQTAFDKKALKLTISALVNDTVGTLVAEYFKDTAAAVGAIIGTGFNACYWEKVSNIGTYFKQLSASEQKSEGDKLMCINMECGNFDSWRHKTLPVTQFDKVIDTLSPNPGQQQLEKMLAGMYLGEICRQVFLTLQLSNVFPDLSCMSRKGDFQTFQLSVYLADTTPNLTEIDANLTKTYGLKTTLEQRQAFREVCDLVATRSARIAAAGIMAIVAKMGVSKATISIDGSVFEKVPGYRKAMADCLDEIHGGPSHNITLVHTRDGSGVGAGLIAALMSQ